MDLETIVRHIEDLESQLSSLKKSVASQNSRIGDLDDKAVNYLEKSRETNNEVSKLRSAIKGLNQFDPALTKLRVDIGRPSGYFHRRNA